MKNWPMKNTYQSVVQTNVPFQVWNWIDEFNNGDFGWGDWYDIPQWSLLMQFLGYCFYHFYYIYVIHRFLPKGHADIQITGVEAKSIAWRSKQTEVGIWKQKLMWNVSQALVIRFIIFFLNFLVWFFILCSYNLFFIKNKLFCLRN